jgi:acetyl-CoA carboxylase biotin carboxyl carrier protein
MSTGAKKAMADQDNKDAEIVSTPERASERGQRERDRDRGRRRHRPSQPRHLEQSVNMNELRELVSLITDNGLSLLELEREGFRVKIGRGPFISEEAANALAAAAGERQISAGPLSAAAPVQSIPTIVAAHPGAQAEEAASEDQDLYLIKSPIVGTFYRSPSPTADSFVRIGSQVEPATVVCIIEAMKLMNEIQAEATGEVAKIYVENGQAVEYGQPLFGVKQA